MEAQGITFSPLNSRSHKHRTRQAAGFAPQSDVFPISLTPKLKMKGLSSGAPWVPSPVLFLSRTHTEKMGGCFVNSKAP